MTAQLSPPKPILIATTHRVTDRQTDRRQYYANSRLYSAKIQTYVAPSGTITQITRLYSTSVQNTDE